jgi:hypothetical protein
MSMGVDEALILADSCSGVTFDSSQEDEMAEALCVLTHAHRELLVEVCELVGRIKHLEDSTRLVRLRPPGRSDLALQALGLGDPPHDGVTVESAPRPGRQPEDMPSMAWTNPRPEPVGVAIFATNDPYEGAILNRADVEALVAWLVAWLSA